MSSENESRKTTDGAKPRKVWEKVWKSKFKEDFVTLPAYLAELACERKAAHERIKLMPRFWQDEKWAKEFKAQMIHANKVLKQYPEVAVIEAFKANPKCYSLSAGWFLQAVRLKANQQKVIQNLVTTSPEPPSCFPGLPEAASAFVGKTSLADKLREVE